MADSEEAPPGRYANKGGERWDYEKHESGRWTRRYGGRDRHSEPGSQRHSNLEEAVKSGGLEIFHDRRKS